MPLEPDTRACLECGEMLRGRVDKKFCDDYCRSAYNNQQYQEHSGLSFIRKVNNVLRRNRRILEEMMPAGEETAKVQRIKLVKKGFNFNYLTSAWVASDGATCYFCYEYGYLPENAEWYHIIKKEEIIK